MNSAALTPLSISFLDADFVIPAVVLCLVASAFFSGVETGLMSVSRIRLRAYERGPRRGNLGLLKRQLQRPEDPILSCLIGTNLFNVMASSLVAAAFVAWFGAIGDVYAAVLMSLLVITLAEILPKMLYREFAESLMLRSTRPLRAAMIVFAPLRAVLLGYSSLLDALLPGARPRDGAGPGREAMASLLRTGGGDGDRFYDELLSRCLALADLDLTTLMTPAVRVVALPVGASLEECREAAVASGFSRLPVYEIDPAQLCGWVSVRDLLFVGDDVPWQGVPEPMIRTFCAVDRRMSPWALFEEMRWQRQQMAMVCDESGTPMGIVTLEDLLEVLVGTIEDEFDGGWARPSLFGPR